LVVGNFLDTEVVESIGTARKLDRTLDERALGRDLVRTDAEALQESRINPEPNDVDEEQPGGRKRDVSDSRAPDLEQQDPSADHRQRDEQAQDRQRRVERRVAGAVSRAARRIEELEAVQIISGGFSQQENGGEREQMRF